MLVNGKEIFTFKAVKLPTQFCLGNISNGFSAIESREGNVYDFSVDYICVDKSDLLNIHKNLMI